MQNVIRKRHLNISDKELQDILYDHVAIFDEAQRAWTKEQTVKFMHQKKGIANFQYSEPEFRSWFCRRIR